MRSHIAWIRDRLRGAIASIITFSLVFELFVAIAIAPLCAGLLGLFLRRWGRCSVGNFELVAFLLSPTGLMAVLIIGAISIASIYLELAGLMLLFVRRPPRLRSTVAELLSQLRGLCALALRQATAHALLAARFCRRLLVCPGDRGAFYCDGRCQFTDGR